jgi:hypothetical protein
MTKAKARQRPDKDKTCANWLHHLVCLVREDQMDRSRYAEPIGDNYDIKTRQQKDNITRQDHNKATTRHSDTKTARQLQDNSQPTTWQQQENARRTRQRQDNKTLRH